MEDKLSDIYDGLVSENNDIMKKLIKEVPESMKNSKYAKTPINKVTRMTGIIVAIVVLIALKKLMNIGNSDNVSPMLPFIIMLIFMFFIFPLTIVGILVIGKKSKNSRLYEEKIVMPLIKNLEFVKECDIDKGIPPQIYSAAKFRDSNYNDYKKSNYIMGYIDKTKIEFSKIITKYEYTVTDSDGNMTTKIKRLFDGLVIVATLDKNIINGYIHIFSDKNKDEKEDKMKVNMDSMEFEQNFDVYATEPVRALEILTSDIMQMLIDEKEKNGYKYEISMTKNMIIMRIFNTEQIFKVRFKENTSSITCKDDLKDNILQDAIFVQNIAIFINNIANDIYDKG